MPVCQNCLNYVTEFPCPHCGCTEPLTKSKPGSIFVEPLNDEIASLNDLITDESIPDNNPSTYENLLTQVGVNSEEIQKGLPEVPIKLSQDLPLESIFPPPVTLCILTPTEQKIYLQLAIEFRLILDKASNYQEALYKWNLILPDRLQLYGLTLDSWQRIAAIGDKDQNLQEQLKKLIEKIFK